MSINVGRRASAAGPLQGEPDDLQSIVKLSVIGVAWMAKAVAPYRKKDRGHLILTGFAAGRMHIKGSIYLATNGSCMDMPETLPMNSASEDSRNGHCGHALFR